MGFVKGVGRAFSDRRVMTAVAGINLASFALGIAWYWEQLARTRVLLWPVVPDCPLAALFVAAALLWRLRGRPSAALDALAWASAIKYGIWTIAVLGHARISGVPGGALGTLLLWSHVGLLGQGIIYALLYPPRRWAILAVPAAWFLVNDVFDYALGTHPNLPLSGQFGFALATAVLTTLVAMGAMIWIYRRTSARFGPRAQRR